MERDGFQLPTSPSLCWMKNWGWGKLWAMTRRFFGFANENNELKKMLHQFRIVAKENFLMCRLMCSPRKNVRYTVVKLLYESCATIQLASSVGVFFK